MQRAHKIRIYPTREQETQLYKTAGTSRYVYNWALDQWKSMYDAFDKGLSQEKPSAAKLSARWTRERPAWATEVARDGQTRAIMDLGTSLPEPLEGTCFLPEVPQEGKKGLFLCRQYPCLYRRQQDLPSQNRQSPLGRASPLPRQDHVLRGIYLRR